VIWNGIYDLTIGPVCFVILCEGSASKVRAKTIAVSTAVQALFGIVMTVAIPYMINPDQANMRGKLGFFFGNKPSILHYSCVMAFITSSCWIERKKMEVRLTCAKFP
jgi:SP family general alpha glucoside:H+ symporter-like MFS transporter